VHSQNTHTIVGRLTLSLYLSLSCLLALTLGRHYDGHLIPCVVQCVLCALLGRNGCWKMAARRRGRQRAGRVRVSLGARPPPFGRPAAAAAGRPCRTGSRARPSREAGAKERARVHRYARLCPAPGRRGRHLPRGGKGGGRGGGGGGGGGRLWGHQASGRRKQTDARTHVQPADQCTHAHTSEPSHIHTHSAHYFPLAPPPAPTRSQQSLIVMHVLQGRRSHALPMPIFTAAPQSVSSANAQVCSNASTASSPSRPLPSRRRGLFCCPSPGDEITRVSPKGRKQAGEDGRKEGSGVEPKWGSVGLSFHSKNRQIDGDKRANLCTKATNGAHTFWLVLSPVESAYVAMA